MSTQVDYKSLGLTAAENYQRCFVPVIPGPLAGDLIELIAPQPGEFVVDVACGTGVVARLVAERVGAEGRVVGVDLNPDMLRIARVIPAAAPIEWRQANAEALPLPDDSYDLVLCQLGLMFVPDQTAAVSEMRRVLSTGGRVAISVPAEMPRLWKVFADALGAHIAPELTGFVTLVFSLTDPNVITGLLREAGFDEVTVTTTTKTLRLPAAKDFVWQYISATPLAELVAAADDDRRHRLESEVVAEWETYVDGDGLAYDQQMLIATASK
ncbi:class I SAM-dependent methyltransferase [Mycobacterium decipiens]|uniref:Methyltransferase type 11 domain-containing protein n=1 Tax=Mycobacterium decipiens TaxID=1430326 RepID=A0A1X2LQP8_9MYCO|nr:methyltransferase domain-containing protein [Mycobacterium decipiens]OSC38739.1 hypothetical protein B8W66_19245 [Mycobacterium decipiens]